MYRSTFLPLGQCCRPAKMSVSRILARSFSTSPVAQQLVKPPIQVFGIEGRYANALYSAAHKQKTLETVEKDLIKLQDSMKTAPKFAEYLKNPSVKRKEKAEAMKTIGTAINMNPATSNLLILLAENGRLGRLNQVVNTFKLLMSATRGEVICEVITAKALDADMKRSLESVLKSFTQKSQTIVLTTKVNPEIIGGMIVSIGDKYVDMSVSSKVKRYSELINTAA